MQQRGYGIPSAMGYQVSILGNRFCRNLRTELKKYRLQVCKNCFCGFSMQLNPRILPKMVRYFFCLPIWINFFCKHRISKNVSKYFSAETWLTKSTPATTVPELGRGGLLQVRRDRTLRQQVPQRPPGLPQREPRQRQAVVKTIRQRAFGWTNTQLHIRLDLLTLYKWEIQKYILYNVKDCFSFIQEQMLWF
jgi:hypothetical protein